MKNHCRDCQYFVVNDILSENFGRDAGTCSRKDVIFGVDASKKFCAAGKLKMLKKIEEIAAGGELKLILTPSRPARMKRFMDFFKGKK